MNRSATLEMLKEVGELWRDAAKQKTTIEARDPSSRREAVSQSDAFSRGSTGHDTPVLLEREPQRNPRDAELRVQSLAGGSQRDRP